MSNQIENMFVLYAPAAKETLEEMLLLITAGRASLNDLSTARALKLFEAPEELSHDELNDVIKSFAQKNETAFPEGKTAYFVYLYGQEPRIGYFCLVNKEKRAYVICAEVHRSADRHETHDPAELPFHFVVPRLKSSIGE